MVTARLCRVERERIVPCRISAYLSENFTAFKDRVSNSPQNARNIYHGHGTMVVKIDCTLSVLWISS